MKKLLLTLTVLVLFSGFAFAQEVEENLPEYCSDDLDQCFLISDMTDDEILLLRQIRAWEQEKDNLQHEQQEFNNSGKNNQKNHLDTRIGELTSKRDNSPEDEVKKTYQDEIDRFERRKLDIDEKNVDNHGSLISELSRNIGKHKEELDKLLVQ